MKRKKSKLSGKDNSFALLYFLFLFVILNTFVPLGQFTICNLTFSQTVHQEWVATYTNPFGQSVGVNDMAIDTNDNIYLTGWILRPDSQGNNFITIKYNSSGVQQWAVEYNGPGYYSNDNAIAIIVDKNENIYVTGRSEQTGLSTWAYCTIKYNSSGIQQWIARYKFNPNSANDSEGPTAIAVDNSGNVYVTGMSEGFGTGLDYATIKYNGLTGDSLWVRRYDGDDHMDDGAEALAIDNLGNVFVTGFSNIGIDSRACTIKYNTNGVQQWLSYLNIDATSGCGSIKLDPITNDIYIGGGIYGQFTSEKEDYLLLKYNSSGMQQWMSIYAGYGYDGNYISDISIDNLHNICVTGQVVNPNPNFHYNYTTIQYNSNGDSLWIQNYDRASSENTPPHLAIDKYNNAYITGLRWNGTNYEFATIKYNTSGVQQWLMTYPGGGKRIKVDKYLNVYVTGRGDTSTQIKTIKYSQPDAIKKISNRIPLTNKLFNNYPNPFNPNTTIKYQITENAFVRISIYDILGRIITVLVNEKQQSGIYEVNWNADKYSSGIYFCKFETFTPSGKNFDEMNKLILAK